MTEGFVRPRLLLLALLLTGLLADCSESGTLGFDDYRVVDLTHTFDESTLYWPTDQPFQHERTAWGRTEGGYWYSSFTYGGSEHGGTHLDAPIHFAEGKRAAAEIPVDELIGPAVVIDITAQCDADPDYRLSVADVHDHERQHGAIEEDAIVMVRTGWSKLWPDAKTYLGSDIPGDTANLHFPGVSPEAAEVLVERGVAVVGIDTASIDHGPTRDFRAHQVFAGAQVACLENVARLEELPARGALVMALPMKIGGGSGAPCRVVAFVPKAGSGDLR